VGLPKVLTRLAEGAFKKVERYAFSFAAFSVAFSDIAVQE
jgi:hypothetical protein